MIGTKARSFAALLRELSLGTLPLPIAIIHRSAWKDPLLRTSALRRSKKLGALGASCRPLTRECGVDHVIDEVLVEPLGLTMDALSPETRPLSYGATLLVFARTQDVTTRFRPSSQKRAPLTPGTQR